MPFLSQSATVLGVALAATAVSRAADHGRETTVLVLLVSLAASYGWVRFWSKFSRGRRALVFSRMSKALGERSKGRLTQSISFDDLKDLQRRRGQAPWDLRFGRARGRG